jgi:hypothetical protein
LASRAAELFERSKPEKKRQLLGFVFSNTVFPNHFYQIHGSHNATLVQALEKMNHPDLTALIPVNKKDPNITKVNGWKMPARNLFNRLRERTSNRVLQMDGVNAPNCDIYEQFQSRTRADRQVRSECFE